MYIELNLDSEVALYQQLKNSIIEAIAKGELKPGDTLPSMRQLASQLSVNTLTVNKAYNQLKIAKFLVINRRKNVVVNDKEQFKATAKELKDISEQLKPIIAEVIARDINLKEFEQVYKNIISSIKGGDIFE
ncbi:GntR family transcriptional regulator [Clostridium sp. 'deep sea']|uniref:GntR family transcriptional regulator n=1 Tax=Clostridium sp. 'deep sea' TaxID=2779445 RepID=UPI0018966CD1|nr:GntR family transcriptional regulator [Clostridium sp. 'deep sea']QOR35296.1 GntR family transcriptional regulator [Clostridium sp. 'deep sea']